MPIQYTSVLEEHRACRTDAAVFDVSHLGSVLVDGPQAHSLLQRAFTNDLDRIGPGRTQYTHLLDEQDAHVVDDIIVWWVGDDEFLVMPNASNTARIVDARRARVPTSRRPERSSRCRGRDARERLATACPGRRRGGAPPRCSAVEFDGVAGLRRGHRLHGRGRRRAARARGRRTCGVAGGARRRRDAGRARRARHPAARGRARRCTATSSAPASRRCRPGSAGSSAGTRATSAAAPLLEAERERGVARHLVGLLAEGRQIPRAECAVLVDGGPGTGGRRRGHERQLLAHARAGHRARVRAPRRGRRRGRDHRRAGPARRGDVVGHALLVALAALRCRATYAVNAGRESPDSAAAASG